MRVKLIAFLITFILLSGYISVETSSGDFILERGSCFKNPFVNNSKLSIPSDKDVKEMVYTAPLAFTENRGQLENDGIRFYTQGGEVWFTDEGVWFELREYAETRGQGLQQFVKTNCLALENSSTFPKSDSRGQGGVSGLDFDPLDRFETREPTQYKRVIVKQEFVGANHVRPEGRERLSWDSNFFYGNDSSKWFTNVLNYREIYYKNLYDGIDLRYYPNGNGLKYDFIVCPGADIRQIRIRYEGADGLEIDNSGNLIIKTSIKNIMDRELNIYQHHAGIQNRVEGKFKLFNEFEYGFEILQEYSKQEILIIDPYVVLEYSTYMGSTEYEGGNGIEVDSQGNAFITGSTQSPNFPTTPGANDTEFNGGSYDIFVLKLNSNGSQLKYSTFIGGSNYDYGRAIAIDSSGNAYVTGDTRSNKFPVTSGAFDPSYNDLEEVIVFKLNHNGSKLVYSTYIGGNDTDRPYDIAVDSIGNAFITGYTRSNDFPTILGSNDTSFNDDRDVIILKLNPTGSGLIYSTFIGDIEEEIGYGIVIDTSGNAYVTGYTRSTNFPVTQDAYDMSHNGSLDVFALKLSQDGKKLVYSTFIGGSNSDIGRDITIDSLDNVYVTGGTYSSDFPTTPNAFNRSSDNRNEIFVFKLNKTGSQLLYSTYIPGNEQDEGYGIDVDTVGNTYITGHTTSTNFPITLNAYDTKLDSREAFLIKLNSSGSTIIYCTYLGGNGSDYGRAITLDLMNNAYIVGRTYDTGFPYTPGAFNGTYGGSGDVFISKFSFKPIINITSLFLYKDNNQTNKIYSGLGPYTFKIDFIYTANLSELGTICLTLDPLGTNIQLQWDYSTLQFSEISDINNYITIDQSSRAYNNIYRWTIEFNLTFNWTYPDENFHNAQVIATSAKLSPAWFNASDFYCVENDLAFNGTLLVEGEKSRIIENDDIVRGGENLTFTGLTVVYENTTDVYPLNNEFNVTISDENENDWVVSTNSGEPFYIDLFTPKVTHTKGYNYTIKITDIPKECDKSNNTFMIRIDADNVSFSDIIPDNNTWNTVKDVLVGINITDTGGGVVNSSTIMHSISINNGNSWGNWVLVPNLGYAMCVVVKDTVTLKEGRDNLIKWRATDSLGNGPTESNFFRILVDTKSVEFSNAWPSGADVSLTEEVEVGITISDKTSGVNAPTIEYSISKDKGKIWNSWQKVEGLNNGLKIDVHINLTFLNGTDNMLKWRAFDIAGNDPVESPPQTINVNTWTPPIIPEVTLISPLNAMIINSSIVNLTWTLVDLNLQNITYDVLFDKNNPPGILHPGVTNANCTVNGLIDGMIYYWQIISYKDGNIKNSFKSDVWWFKVELSKPVDVIYKITITGPKLISMYQGEKKDVSLTITNLGTTVDTINLKIKESNLSNYISLNNYTILKMGSNNFDIRTLKIILPDEVQPGTYEILITAISLNSGENVKSNHTITLEIKKVNGTQDGIDQDGDSQKKGQKSDNLILFILIGVIVIIIIILTVLFVILKQKRQNAQKLSAETTITTKPLPTQVISLGETPQKTILQLQQPIQTVIPSSTLQQPQAVISSLPIAAQQPITFQQPSVDSTETLTQDPSILQTTKTPQLPPAQIPPSTPEQPPITTQVPQPPIQPQPQAEPTPQPQVAVAPQQPSSDKPEKNESKQNEEQS